MTFAKPKIRRRGQRKEEISPLEEFEEHGDIDFKRRVNGKTVSLGLPYDSPSDEDFAFEVGRHMHPFIVRVPDNLERKAQFETRKLSQIERQDEHGRSKLAHWLPEIRSSDKHLNLFSGFAIHQYLSEVLPELETVEDLAYALSTNNTPAVQRFADEHRDRIEALARDTYEELFPFDPEKERIEQLVKKYQKELESGNASRDAVEWRIGDQDELLQPYIQEFLSSSEDQFDVEFEKSRQVREGSVISYTRPKITLRSGGYVCEISTEQLYGSEEHNCLSNKAREVTISEKRLIGKKEKKHIKIQKGETTADTVILEERVNGQSVLEEKNLEIVKSDPLANEIYEFIQTSNLPEPTVLVSDRGIWFYLDKSDVKLKLEQGSFLGDFFNEHFGYEQEFRRGEKWEPLSRDAYENQSPRRITVETRYRE